jgi:hypothetical protein
MLRLKLLEANGRNPVLEDRPTDDLMSLNGSRSAGRRHASRAAGCRQRGCGRGDSQALTAPSRLLILTQLRQSPATVSQQTEAVGMEQSAVSTSCVSAPRIGLRS